MAASSPPSGCPMHAALPAPPPPSASPPSGCPMHAARPAKADEINPVCLRRSHCILATRCALALPPSSMCSLTN
eukprot:scaffold71954_cov54-Phaeocystis_antarctica.AAC.2